MRGAESAFGDGPSSSTGVVNRGTSRCRSWPNGAPATWCTSTSATASVQRPGTRRSSRSPGAQPHPELRATICADAVSFARHIGYVNAGTVEFLLDERGKHFSIEMNPADPGRAHRHRSR